MWRFNNFSVDKYFFDLIKKNFKNKLVSCCKIVVEMKKKLYEIYNQIKKKTKNLMVFTSVKYTHNTHAHTEGEGEKLKYWMNTQK